MTWQVEEVLNKLQRLGWCDKCKTWCTLEKGKSYLPKHKNKSGKDCPNAKYSYDKLKYAVPNMKAAVAVAEFIKGDAGLCLASGEKWHSLGCGDGDNCEEARMHLAKALAEYFLKKQEKFQK